MQLQPSANQRLKTMWQWRLTSLGDRILILTTIGMFLLFIIGFAIVQNGTTALAGNDGYYHIKMGYLIRNEGLTPDFPYLPQTILNEAAYYDHHLLYHVYLALFASVDPAVDEGVGLTQAAKLASILLPALAFLAIWWLLHNHKIPFAGLFALTLFAVSEPFLYRMSMPRAQSLSLLLLIIGLHWLLQGKYSRLLPLGFIYVWAYNAFPLLLIFAGVYVIATLMTEQRFVWQALFYPAIGIGLGLVINPYFPQNIEFIWGHLAPKLGESSTRVGTEWSPYRTWTLVENSAGAFLALLAGILALGWSDRRISKNTLVILGITVLFGYMLFESRRFVEYFPPFALLFLAFSSQPIIQSWQETWQSHQPLLFQLAPVVLVIALAYPLFITISDARGLMENSKPADQYANAVLWLRQNSLAGTHIFQTDWDDFTRLFFYNSDAIYTAGLDPTFMELHDPALFEEWVDITRGRVEDPSQLIRSRFDGEYVFSDLKHESFIAEAEQDPFLTEVYRDDYAVIYKVGTK